MERKQIIQPGTRWGTLTYIKDIECFETKKRPILVKCDCGVTKQIDLAAVRQNPLISTCGSSVCRRKIQEQILARLSQIEQVKEVVKTVVKIELSELTEYWDEIEQTGNVHNIANGMVLTKQFLVN